MTLFLKKLFNIISIFSVHLVHPLRFSAWFKGAYLANDIGQIDPYLIFCSRPLEKVVCFSVPWYYSQFLYHFRQYWHDLFNIPITFIHSSDKRANYCWGCMGITTLAALGLFALSNDDIWPFSVSLLVFHLFNHHMLTLLTIFFTANVL